MKPAREFFGLTVFWDSLAILDGAFQFLMNKLKLFEFWSTNSYLTPVIHFSRTGSVCASVTAPLLGLKEFYFLEKATAG